MIFPANNPANASAFDEEEEEEEEEEEATRGSLKFLYRGCDEPKS